MKLTPLAYILIVVTNLGLYSCAHPQDSQGMKATVDRLITALIKCDSTTIINLIDDERVKDEEKSSWKEDCKFFNQIIAKYGSPKKKNMKVFERYRENIEI